MLSKPKEFVVEGYILDLDRILLLHHKKLNLWLPPGGHVEKNETPEVALLREIKEEVGLDVEISRKKRFSKTFDVELLYQPTHLQLENIGDSHQHIDLVYLCRITGGKLMTNEESKNAKWFGLNELRVAEGIPEEVKFFGEMFIRMESNKIEKKNPVLTGLINDLDDTTRQHFQKNCLLVVQHLQKNTINFIKLLSEAGFKEVIIIAKPYSTNVEAAKEISKNAQVLEISREGETIKELIRQELDRLITQKQSFLAMDLGGDIAEALNDYDEKSLAQYFGGVVEDTKNGLHWLEKSNEPLKFPLISVASSFLKDGVEAPFVGSSISRNLENLFVNSLSVDLASKRVLVLGYGPIGKNVAAQLRNKNCIVDVAEINPVRRVLAVIDGFGVLHKKTHLSVYDVIVGATGQESIIDESDIPHLKNGVVLVNASTRNREFSHAALDKLSKKTEEIGAFGTRITLYNKKRIYLAANGYPLNFFNNESTPSSVLDLVFSELFISLQLLVTKKLDKRLYKLELDWPEMENDVAERWYTFWHKYK